MISFPCVCGHDKNLHLHFDNKNDSRCRKTVGVGIRGQFAADSCKKYIPDNLKYLEQKYNEIFE